MTAEARELYGGKAAFRLDAARHIIECTRFELDTDERFKENIDKLAYLDNLPEAPDATTPPAQALPHYPGSTSIKDLLPPIQNRDARTKFRRTIYTLGMLAALTVARYGANVHDGEVKALQSQPSISEVFESDNPAVKHTMVVDFDGLSGRDAHDAASAEVAYKEKGDVYAIKYGNNVDAAPIATAIIEQAKTANKTSIILSGRSMGGIVAINTAIEIAKQSKGELKIPYIILDSSPSSIESVWPDKLTYVDYINLALAIFPKIQYSSDANFIGQYIGQFLGDPSTIVGKNIITNTLDAVSYYYEVNADKKAQPYLLSSEYNAIVAGDVEDKLSELSKLTGDNKPILVLMQPVQLDKATDQYVTADLTINSAISAKEYTEFAAKANLPLLIIQVPGTVHANPGYRPGEWNTGMIKQVFPAIQAEQQQIAVVHSLSAVVLAAEAAQHPDDDKTPDQEAAPAAPIPSIASPHK